MYLLKLLTFYFQNVLTFIRLCIIIEIQKNLHVALIMDCANSKFSVNCESNPAFFKQCTVQWLDSWSRESMIKVFLQSLIKIRSEIFILIVRRYGPFTPGEKSEDESENFSLMLVANSLIVFAYSLIFLAFAPAFASCE